MNDNNNDIKIAFGDLRHKIVGRHSIFMPIGIGFIASYIMKYNCISKNSMKFFVNSEEMIKVIKSWSPDVLALSNYCWNSELSNLVFSLAKKLNPNIISIAGGPEFPFVDGEREIYLKDLKNIDFYICGEGEVAFSELISKIQKDSSLISLKSEVHRGVAYLDLKTSYIVVGDAIPRLTDLDIIPSPYQNGIMDKWFNGKYAPSYEFARGCPFTCAYCYNGNSYYSKLSRFSVARVKKDLEYIAKSMQCYPTILLSICDSNFGMYKEEEEIADFISTLQDKYGWPNVFDVTTGKTNHDRIIKICSTLKNKMSVSSSVQSLNKETLNIIKRVNFPFDKYVEIQNRIKKQGMTSGVELIMPMPAETKKSFLNTIKILLEVGINNILPYTFMLLKGTILASTEFRDKYSYTTKYRIIPHQFGEYDGKKCFEIEEVCVATNTMSFQDYLDCRGYAFLSLLISLEQYDVIFNHIQELNIDKFSFISRLYSRVINGQTKLLELYNDYIQESIDELKDSKSEIYDFFSKSEIYDKLLRGELGDNLIRKYRTIIFQKYNDVMIDLLYQNLFSFVDEIDCENKKNILDSLNDAKRWILEMRDIGQTFHNADYRERTDFLSLNYDVNGWYESKNSNKKLINFRKFVNYQINTDVDALEKILQKAYELYNDDDFYAFCKTLVNWRISYFWRRTKLKDE